MNSTEIKDLLTVVTALTGLAAALIGIFKYFKYQSRRDRHGRGRHALRERRRRARSKDEVKRRAAAIMLRRFFDAAPSSARRERLRERGVNVIAGGTARGAKQQLPEAARRRALVRTLAAPRRPAEDQPENAYLGSRGDAPLDLSGADF
jgi:hypothetical protein